MDNRNWLWALAASGLLLFAAPSFAKQVGSVSKLIGSADVVRDDAAPKNLTLEAPILVQDKLRTGRQSELIITMADKSRLTLGENSRIEISNYRTEGEPNGVIEVARGRLRAFVSDLFSSRSESFKVKTPSAIAGVQGTDFIVIVHARYTQVIVFEGMTVVYSPNPKILKRVILRKGQTSIIREGEAPLPATPVNLLTLGDLLGGGDTEETEAGAASGGG
ncbi:MAG: FecR family protein, partial [Gammaproteobacteria bacterium]|nr:FecR family protein [Gammaproteobacteria bacterium]